MTNWLALLLLAQPVPAARQHLERGFALAQAGDLKAAEVELRLAVDLAPGDAQALALLGIALSQQGNLAEATPLLERASKLDPGNVNTRYNLALNQLRLGNRTSAQANLERIIREQPDHKQAVALLASMQRKNGYEAALDEYRAGRLAQSRSLLEQLIGDGSRDPNVFRLLAWCHHRQGQVEEALSAIRQAIELAPREPALYANAAQILLEQRNLDAARAAVMKALELSPDNAAALKLEGTLAVARGDFKQALASYQRAAESDPSDPEAVERLGTAQWMLLRYAEARTTFETGIDRFPSYARLYVAYAKLLHDLGFPASAGAESRARGLIEKALALDPSLADAHYEFGKLLLMEAKTSEAVHHLETAAKLDPANRPVHLTLANAYRVLGRRADQAKELERYRQLGDQEVR
jgi:tetratricopeptide (TPR) repeat protein